MNEMALAGEGDLRGGKLISPKRVKELLSRPKIHGAPVGATTNLNTETMLAYLSLTSTAEAVKYAGSEKVRKQIAEEGLPSWCYSAERDKGGKMILQCNCCGVQAIEKHMASNKHSDMLRSMKGSPKAILLERIKMNARSNVASFIEENRFDAGATSSRDRPGGFSSTLGTFRSVASTSRPATVASADNFDTAREPIEPGTPRTGTTSQDDGIATLAPNALCLTSVQLVCIHRQFERLAFDAQRYGCSKDKLQPVVTLKDGNETYYFIKMPDGTSLQIVPASSGGKEMFDQQNKYESIETFVKHNPSMAPVREVEPDNIGDEESMYTPRSNNDGWDTYFGYNQMQCQICGSDGHPTDQCGNGPAEGDSAKRRRVGHEEALRVLKPPESSVILVDDSNRPTAPPPPEDDTSNTAMDTAVGSIGDADSAQSDTEERRSTAPQPPSNFNRPVTNDD